MMNPKGRVAPYLKRLARDLLPPMFTRGLKPLMIDHAGDDPLRIIKRTHNHTLLAGGIRIHHRDSLADTGVVDQIFFARDYDLARFKRYGEVLAAYEANLQPLILDCGANLGASALWFAETFPRATVVAVEPERENYALLTSNCDGRKIVPILGAVAATSGTMKLFDPGEGEWAFRVGGVETGQPMYEVEAFSIAALLNNQSGQPFILKIDIEGAEAGLFAEATEVFDRFPVIIIELHDWMLPGTANSSSFLKWHSARNRDFILHGENVISFSNSLLSPAP